MKKFKMIQLFLNGLSMRILLNTRPKSKKNLHKFPKLLNTGKSLVKTLRQPKRIKINS
jgi:hypothetical protein